ncbi:META domain-containing protein [Rhizocola hellebori]|uniref:META domain-containing protein n=1 Tax=Rhizocola hellebori TaxID=1392758 RepID=A0A8J3VLC3_9ACTN|nr:META domain-containing protein [Rhizocola hellebori]GIH10705.1 META domain-containing protein [Rhizocola hellebori]
MRIGLALTAVLSLAVAGCGGSGSGPGSPGVRPATGSELTGRTFLSTEVGAHALVPGTQISLGFPEQGKLTARAGCNSLFGDVEFKADKMAVSGMGSTDMGCDKARHEQDEWLSTFLEGAPAWALKGDELVLTGKDGEIRLADRHVANPDRPILGSRWVVESTLDVDAASSVPAEMRPAEFTILEDGTVTGYSGCNRFTGTATVSPGKIKFGPLASTKMACGGVIDAIERNVLAVLDGEVSATAQGDTLVLKHPSGKGLQLRVLG